ncbi:MAG TPA: glycerophosphodiester phosphodiesterase [Gemmataceae bacterium]
MKWLLVALSVVAFALPAPAAEIVAHRGESADAPENTLASFRLAWDQRDDAIELDVHLTKDGQLIVCHDPDTKRTTGVPHKIKDTPFDVLRSLDAGKWKGPKWAGEKLPTLAEVLATIPDGKRCFIEIKVGPEAVPAVAKAVRESGKKPEQMPIISFKADTLAEAKRQLPDHKAYFLANFKQDKKTKQWTGDIDQFIATAKAIHADGLDLGYQGPVDREAARKVKAAGLAFLVWTVDDPAVAKRMIDYGAKGITTNKAAWLRGQLKRE